METVRRETLSQMADTLKRHYGASAVWVFGSVAEGTAGPDSDLDLLIVSRTSEPFYQRMATVRRLLRPFHGEYPVSPIVLTPDELERRLAVGDQFIAGITEQGIQL